MIECSSTYKRMATQNDIKPNLKLSILHILLTILCVLIGMISLVLNSDWKEPWDNSTENIDAASRALTWNFEWFAYPIYLTGDYPEVSEDSCSLV